MTHTAVILAGGQGSRLRPLTENIPKPMVTVLGRPMMEHIVRHLARYDVSRTVATLHYRAQVIRNHFDDGSDFGVQMDYTLETEPLGTAGSVKLAEQSLTEPFFVVAGDALIDFDFNAFRQFHEASGALVSICLTRVRDPGEFGIVITDAEGRVQRFLEKPGPGEVFSDTVNTGIYLIQPEVLAEIPSNQSYDFSGDLFPKLLAQGKPIYGYVAEGYWSDIGTLSQLRQAHWDLLDGKVDLPISGTRIGEGVWIGEGADIDPAAEVKGPSWLGRNVRIHPGARIGPYAVLTDNSEVEHHSTVNHSIVMRNSFVGTGSHIRNAMIGPNNIVESGCEVRDDAVIGAGCRIGREVVIRSGVLIWPEKQIDAGATVMENLVWESLMRPSLFGSRGVSGLANLHITPEFACVLGKAFGSWAGPNRSVTVSRDDHPFSRLIKRALVSGLMSVGIDVQDAEATTAPVTRFVTTEHRQTAGGMHVRIADEHPQVGLIEMYSSDGLPLGRNARRKVEATYYRGDFPKRSLNQVGHLQYAGQIQERYLEQLTQHVDLSGLAHHTRQTVVYCDDDHTANLLTQTLGRRGVPHLRAGGLSAAELEDKLHHLTQIARLNHAMAVYIDKNGEGLELIDDHGNRLSRSRTEEVITAAFIESAPTNEPVFLPPDHAVFLRTHAERYGRNVVLTRKDPSARLEQAFAQVHSTGVWPEFMHYYLGFDAVAAVLQLLVFLGNRNVTLFEYERSLPPSNRDQFSLHCPWDEMGRVMRELAQQTSVDLESVPEGVKLRYPEGEVFVLPSSDLPQLDVSVEVVEDVTAAQFVDEIYRQLGRIIS